jgi:hypothetical protein
LRLLNSMTLGQPRLTLMASCWFKVIDADAGTAMPPPHPRRQRPVPPSLIALCFNCLAGDHIATRCTFSSRCLLCLSTRHQARNWKHGRPPWRLPSDRMQGPLRCSHAASQPRQPRRGRHGVHDNNSSVHQGAVGVSEPQAPIIVRHILCSARTPPPTFTVVGGGPRPSSHAPPSGSAGATQGTVVAWWVPMASP